MRKGKRPLIKFVEWLELHWLRVFSPTFRNHRDKRKAYYEYRLGKKYNRPCS